MRDTGRTTKANDNVGESEQTKDQTLTLKGTTNVFGSLILKKGSIFQFQDGNEKDGYTLTSDNNGNMRWVAGTNVPASPKNAIQFNKNDRYAGSSDFLFDPRLRALSLGKRAEGDIGINSFSHGLLNKASGTASHAHGKTTTTLGTYSHTEGAFTCAVADFTHAEGFKTCAKGESSHAEGYCTETSGKGSHAEGHSTFTFGKFSHVEGRKTKAQGGYSHAEGNSTISAGAYSHVEGSNSQSLGMSSHAEGISTCAVAEGSHSQGSFTNAKGLSSFSSGAGIFGKEVKASGNHSFNHSVNTAKQEVGHGALADSSAILGGVNHHIDEANTGATIIGGNSIKLIGTQYPNTTAVGNLAVFETPLNGGNDDILTWDSQSKKMGKISQATPADVRTKDLEKLEFVLEGLKTLNLYTAVNNSKVVPVSAQGYASYSLVAQEVEKVFPLAVKENIRYNDKVFKGINYGEMVPVLVQAINELTAKLDTMTSKLTELDLKVNG